MSKEKISASAIDGIADNETKKVLLKAPWLQHYGNVPKTIAYPDLSMIDMLEKVALQYPENIAYDFYGSAVTYTKFIAQIHECAKALKAIGIQEGECVTVCMPNTPQAVILFYAINRIGALANMIHPLSSEGEIEFYINSSNSVAVLILDQFYPKFQAISHKIHVRHLLITSIKDALPFVKSIVFSVAKRNNKQQLPKSTNIILWRELIKQGAEYKGDYTAYPKGNDTAIILYSGGTTGTTKGILLSNLNFNALAMQTAAAGDCLVPGHTMLSIMPVFHGFGLGIGIHTILLHGAKCILVPQFTVKSYAQLLKKHRPNYIAGVPTLFEALLRIKKTKSLNLSCLEGVFCGGDSLSIELKRKVDVFLKERGATIQVREGYGTTECVTASCLTPKDFYREGSIGLPYPDTFYKIVTPYTQEEVPYGEVGEICISGPTVMQGYADNPKETALTLQDHADGMLWLHTGDLGSMDEDGFIYFKQRLKRMIISSGYNIYPSQLENIIDAHEAVLMSTVIGVKDRYKMQKVKAFIVLKPEYTLTEELKAAIWRHCHKNIAKYAMPYEFEFRDKLPTTLVGKVAYVVLEKEEAEKMQGEE